MIQREILYFGKRVILACDGKCEKAWGVGDRPRVELDPRDPDDWAWLADHELGIAPVDPGTYEGFQGKPEPDEKLESKWCARACERSTIVDMGQPIVLRDLSRRRFHNKQPYYRPDREDAVMPKATNLRRATTVEILRELAARGWSLEGMGAYLAPPEHTQHLLSKADLPSRDAPDAQAPSAEPTVWETLEKLVAEHDVVLYHNEIGWFVDAGHVSDDSTPLVHKAPSLARAIMAAARGPTPTQETDT